VIIFLYKPKIIGRFADLKADLFPNSPLHSIIPVIKLIQVNYITVIEDVPCWDIKALALLVKMCWDS
jgi:hypothetical protein